MDAQRRPVTPSMIARKSSRPVGSGTTTLRQRLGNQAFSGMSEIESHSKGSPQTRSSANQAKLTVSPEDDVDHKLMILRCRRSERSGSTRIIGVLPVDVSAANMTAGSQGPSAQFQSDES